MTFTLFVVLGGIRTVRCFVLDSQPVTPCTMLLKSVANILMIIFGNLLQGVLQNKA